MDDILSGKKVSNLRHILEALNLFLRLFPMKCWWLRWLQSVLWAILDTCPSNTSKWKPSPLYPRSIPAECKLFYLHLNLLSQSTVIPLQVYIIILTAVRSICLPPSMPSAVWLSFTPVFSSPLGFCLVEPILSFSSATRHSSFPYQCQAVRAGGSQAVGFSCCTAQPCICNHSGCCGADWCSSVEPCCRWVISRSLGYTSLPLINCPINPAAERIMLS